MMLNDKVALVTGAGKGIGAAIARKLAAEGAKVYVHYRSSKESAEALALEISGIAVQADLSSVSGVESLLETIQEPLQILVNNAGLTNDMLVIQMDEAAWKAPFSVNLDAIFYLSQVVGQRMMRQKNWKHHQYYVCCWHSPQSWSSQLCCQQSCSTGFYSILCKRACKEESSVQLRRTGFY